MTETARLRWQCRRGMKELDVLLERYLNVRYDDASEDEKLAFRKVLELADPELNSYLLQREKPSSEPVASVIQQILNLPHS